MSDATTIEWTDSTWNPVRGCSIVSKGCTNCYAMKQAHRFSGAGQAYEGLTQMTRGGPVWTGKVRLVPELLDQPLRWRKPRRIFVNSMSDLFHEDVPDAFIDQVFAVMCKCCPRFDAQDRYAHTFQILTKRPARMQAYMTDKNRIERVFVACGKTPLCGRSSPPPWPLPNVWVGVSTEDQPRADERIPLLLQTPAAVRFVSYEPALEAVDFKLDHLKRHAIEGDGVKRLDWLIVGGESGPKARPFDLAWARSTVAQCKAACVPVFMKQLGRYPMPESDDLCGLRSKGHSFYRGWLLRYCDEDERVSVDLKDRAGGDMAEWPEDLRVREYPA